MLENLVTHYGYLALLLGTFLEGEAILVIGGLMAHQGYLSLPWVMTVALIGSFAGDQFYFYLGRKKGRSLIKSPSMQSKLEKVFRLIQKHENWLIVGFRFIYGIRTITPIALGLSRVSYLKYSLLNFLGALVWSITITLVGYSFGHLAEGLMGDLKKYEEIILIIVIAVFIGGLLIHWQLKRRSR
ncbi:DedA family protein [Gynuella sp.]|uniref:DedA family protein n=1 Tax=Gynuella sp. TaxID=2969146 RepID=UPI003D0C37E3